MKSIRFFVCASAFVLLATLSLSCKRTASESDGFVVRFEDKVLTRSVLDEYLPDNITPEDSLIVSEHFIRTWINEQLIYSVASKNIADKKKIDDLVENYRKALIISQYEEQLVREKLSAKIEEKAMREYYEANRDKFKTDKPLVKGIFLKAPADAPNIDALRNLYKTVSPANREKIEQYCVRNAVEFNYFTDEWRDFYELTDKFPSNYRNKSVSSKDIIEQKDEHFYYFLNITALLNTGDIAPFEYVKTMVQEMLINRSKIDFLKKTEDELYEKALKKGQIELRIEN